MLYYSWRKFGLDHNHSPGNIIRPPFSNEGTIIHLGEEVTDAKGKRYYVMHFWLDVERILQEWANELALSFFGPADLPYVVQNFLETNDESVRQNALQLCPPIPETIRSGIGEYLVRDTQYLTDYEIQQLIPTAACLRDYNAVLKYVVYYDLQKAHQEILQNKVKTALSNHFQALINKLNI
jgi:hypothetical protein